MEAFDLDIETDERPTVASPLVGGIMSFFNGHKLVKRPTEAGQNVNGPSLGDMTSSCQRIIQTSLFQKSFVGLVAVTVIVLLIPVGRTGSGNGGHTFHKNQREALYDIAYFDGLDLTDTYNMKSRLQRFRKKWIDEHMKAEYGEYYLDIFEPMDPTTNARENIGKQRAFQPPNNLPQGSRPVQKHGPSWSRMVRKFQIKLLQVQLGMLEERMNPSGYFYPPTEAHEMKPNHYAKFVWATGGHSSAAAHGNFYRESYTAVLGRDLQPIMSAIGLDWQVRNYAMGGMESGEEIALCVNSIFGKDIDSLSWDYELTDGQELNKMILYAYRAARISQIKDNLSQPGDIRHRPSFISIHNQRGTPELETFQNLGMTVLGMNEKVRLAMEAAFPDMYGKSDADINNLPPSVQYFKCLDKIEIGEPGCLDHKYNTTTCPVRRGMASWHPGKKYHALVGHMLALTILEVIDQAMDELIRAESTTRERPRQKQLRLQNQLAELDRLEQQDYDAIFASPLPDNLAEYFERYQWKGNNQQVNKQAMSSMQLERLVKDSAFCHTALLPAEIRYRGYLTETSELVGSALDGNYEDAMFLSKIQESENPYPNSGKEAAIVAFSDSQRAQNMILVGSEDERENQCPALTRVDYKDFFFVSSMEGWRQVSIPNAMEQRYYTEFDASTSHGYILFCLTKCDWGRCPAGDIRNSVVEWSADESYGQLEMQVNGIAVVGTNCMNACCALKHEHPVPAQQFVWKPNAEGRYDVKARIQGSTTYSYARFSSFVLL